MLQEEGSSCDEPLLIEAWAQLTYSSTDALFHSNCAAVVAFLASPQNQ